MIPFQASGGGSFQDTSILVDVLAVREMLVGGCDGTEIKQLNNNYFKTYFLGIFKSD